MALRFRNPWPGSQPRGVLSVARWGLARLLGSSRRGPAVPAFPVVPPAFDTPRAAAEAVSITWVGHSTLLVQIGGRNVLTDPMWSRRASPVQWAGPARVVPPAIPLDGLPPLDAVVLSHNHYDHLDVATVRRIAARWPDTDWIVPRGLAGFVRARGVRRVTERAWWETARAAGLEFHCTPAQHFSQRGPRDRNRTLWCGWVIVGGGHRVYFAGDTGYHPQFGDVARRLGPIDIACLPVGAYEPRWFMRSMHMNPEDALQAFEDLHADNPRRARAVMVPIHWGTFKLTDEALDEPPDRTRRAWAARGLPADGLWLLAHGETRALPAGPVRADDRYASITRARRAFGEEHDRVELTQPLEDLAPDAARSEIDGRRGVLDRR